jgi:hypothetical protein
MAATIQQFVVADRSRTDATGAIVAIPTGYTLQSGADGFGVWTNVPAAIINFAEFLHDNETDTAAIIPGAPFRFGSAPGPASASTTITRVPGAGATSNSRFILGVAGTYRVTWQASIVEPGQMMLALSDSATPGTPAEIPRTVAGRVTGESQISNNTLITTAFPNARLELRNPAGNPTSLTLSTAAGGAANAWANLTIQ